MNKHLIVLIGFVVFSACLFATPFTVVSQDANQVTLKFVLPRYQLQTIQLNGADYQKIQAEGSSYLCDEGKPLLPYYAEVLGIPVDGDISFRIVSQKTEKKHNVKIQPAEKMIVDERGVTDIFYQDAKAYRSSISYPGEILIKRKSAFVGDRNMQPVHLVPFQYKAAQKELTIVTEMVFTVLISGSKEETRSWSASKNFIDVAADSFFVNNAFSKKWRKTKEIATNYATPRETGDMISSLNLIVNKDGIYKITYEYLQDHIQALQDSLDITINLDLANLDPRNLELSNNNNPVPIHFQGESDGHFGEGDYFEFYGEMHHGDTSYYDSYTDANVYKLRFNNYLGSRMVVENGGLVSNASHYTIPDAFESTIHLEQQQIMDKLGYMYNLNEKFYRDDVWFWRKITAPNLEIIPFQLQYPKDSSIRGFKATISLVGITYNESLGQTETDHHALVRINNALIGTHRWRQQNEQIFTNEQPLANAYLSNGTNTLFIDLPGDTPQGNREQIALDYAEIKYWRLYQTSEDFIKFSKPSYQPAKLFQFTLDGFTNDQISVYKIGSSILNNLQIEPYTLGGDAPYKVTFQDSVSSNDVWFYAVTEDNKMLPLKILADFPSDLKNPANAANCIIITSRDFINDEGTLLFKQMWESMNHTVKIVDVQDIYDEFNYGVKSSAALKDFISYAYNNWSAPQLGNILLLGEGTDDERDFSDTEPYNIIPVKKIWTNKHGATASDNWYACIIGDDPISDLSISRINVWKNDQILPIAQKTQQYIDTPYLNELWVGQVTLASGGTSNDVEATFALQSEETRRNTIPSDYYVTRIYTAPPPSLSAYYAGTTLLKDRINQGTTFLQFMGHGGGRIWSDYNLFDLEEVATLNNHIYPFVSSLACYCSSFDTKGNSSIGEAFVMQAGRGAIGTIGFSGLGYLYQDLDFSFALTEGMFLRNFSSIGDIIGYTKARFYSLSYSVALDALTVGAAQLGDPMVPIRQPLRSINIDVQNKFVYAPGDTLNVSVQFPTGVTNARLNIFDEKELLKNIPFDIPVSNGVFSVRYVFPNVATDSYFRKIRVVGADTEHEYVATTMVAVGRSNISDIVLTPANPSIADSVQIEVKASDPNGLTSVHCKVLIPSTPTNIYLNIPMVLVNPEENIYRTTTWIPTARAGAVVQYNFRLVNSLNTPIETPYNYYTVSGPDLFVRDYRAKHVDHQPAIEILVKNLGTAVSHTTDLTFSTVHWGYSENGHWEELFTVEQTQSVLPIAPGSERWEQIILSRPYPEVDTVEVQVNKTRSFSEIGTELNNKIRFTLLNNDYVVNNDGMTIQSLDHNLTCIVPTGFIPSPGEATMAVLDLQPKSALNQPDALPLKMANNVLSIPYSIQITDTEIVDSLGYFLNNMKIRTIFRYSQSDSLVHLQATANNFKVYRWEEVYSKWICQGGETSQDSSYVIYSIDRSGIYTLLRNNDNIRPSIDANVQDQEFSYGGYVSGTGVISVLLSDANGIDIFQYPMKIYMDGQLIPASNYAISYQPNLINRIPIKYQLNLGQGTYTLLIECTDVNGNFNSRAINFTVNTDFDVMHVANYPNPVVNRAIEPINDARTRFTYILTDDADKVSIKVYTVSGRLVKTFNDIPSGIGYHEYPRTVYGWDCTDEQGFELANGVYFYRIIAEKGNKKIEKTQKLAILK